MSVAAGSTLGRVPIHRGSQSGGGLSTGRSMAADLIVGSDLQSSTARVFALGLGRLFGVPTARSAWPDGSSLEGR
jgi:hypothetical protein